MNAVQHLPGHRAVRMTFVLLIAIGALVLAGLIGYLVKGSTTLIAPTSVSAPASVAPIASHANPDAVDAAAQGTRSIPRSAPDTLDHAGSGTGSVPHPAPDTLDHVGR